MLDTSYGQQLLEESLSWSSIVVYHTLAVFFTSLNIRIVGLLMCWHQQDALQAREIQRNHALEDHKTISKE